MLVPAHVSSCHARIAMTAKRCCAEPKCLSSDIVHRTYSHMLRPFGAENGDGVPST